MIKEKLTSLPKVRWTLIIKYKKLINQTVRKN